MTLIETTWENKKKPEGSGLCSYKDAEYGCTYRLKDGEAF